MFTKILLVSEHIAVITDKADEKSTFVIPLKDVSQALEQMIRVYNNDFFTYTMEDILRYVVDSHLTDEATARSLNRYFDTRKIC